MAKVASLGIHILDILGRHVNRIPEGQHVDLIDEIRLIASRCGPFDVAMQLLADDKVTLDPLISARFPLEDAVIAFEHATQKHILKVLFDVA